jgi:hypothetical protein
MPSSSKRSRNPAAAASSEIDAPLAEYRRLTFRHQHDLAIDSQADALKFIDHVGLCLFQPNRKVLLPSLYGAAIGSDRPAPRWGQHDAVYGRVWGWKDSLFSDGNVLYGKALGDYRLFVSLRLLPYLYALSDMNYGGDEDDYLELYQDGKLSLDAKCIYDVLVEYGPSSTTLLRRRSGMVGKGAAAGRFERALTELQRGLMVAAVGVSDDNAWKYTFRYDTVIRKFPSQVEAARQMKAREATIHVLRHYLWLVGQTTLGQITRLFGWDPDRLWRVAQSAASEGQVECLGERAEALVSLLEAPDGAPIWYNARRASCP